MSLPVHSVSAKDGQERIDQAFLGEMIANENITLCTENERGAISPPDITVLRA